MRPQHVERRSWRRGWVELQMTASEASKSKGFGAVFSEGASVDDDAQVLVGRPQAGVEHPVRILREGEAVRRVVIPGRGSSLNVRSIDDGSTVSGEAAVAGKCASIAVSRGDKDGESDASAFALRGFFRFLHHPSG